MSMETTGHARTVTRLIGDWLILSFLFEFSSQSPITVSQYISYAPIVHVSNSFYLFGGNSGATLNEKTIGRFDIETRKWTNVGSLVTGRYGHNAIYDGQYVLIVGGVGILQTEKCTIINKRVTCSSQSPELDGYVYYPEVFLVPESYCEQLY